MGPMIRIGLLLCAWLLLVLALASSAPEPVSVRAWVCQDTLCRERGAVAFELATVTVQVFVPVHVENRHLRYWLECDGAFITGTGTGKAPLALDGRTDPPLFLADYRRIEAADRCVVHAELFRQRVNDDGAIVTTAHRAQSGPLIIQSKR